jgi:hypothetical protein
MRSNFAVNGLAVEVLKPEKSSLTGGVHFRLTYAITPPRTTTPPERRAEIAELQSSRIRALPIDALLVYDVQDEAARNSEPRPFPFSPKIDPLTYAYQDLKIGQLPRVVYHAVASQPERAFERWIARLRACGGVAVLVGAPSRVTVPVLPLTKAYELWRAHEPARPLGGVVIAERHRSTGTEAARVLRKVQQGCQFFVSQTVWDIDATKQLLLDVLRQHERSGLPLPHIIVTLSPCGSRQTLDFQEWLGVSVPAVIQRELRQSRDMLGDSVKLACELYGELQNFAADLGIPLGCNVESASWRADEVDASTELLWRVASLQRHHCPPITFAPRN